MLVKSIAVEGTMPVRQVDFTQSRCKKLRRLGITFQLLDQRGLPIRTVNEYLRLQCLAWSRNTVRTYAGHLDRFFNWLTLNNVDLLDLNDEILADFAFDLASKRELKVSTCVSALGAAHRFIEWSSTNLPGALPAFQCQRPAALLSGARARMKLVPKQIIPLLPRFVPKKSADAFIAKLAEDTKFGVRNNLIGRLMRESGLRVDEVVRLSVNCLPILPNLSATDLLSNSVRQTATIIAIVGKGSKHRFVALPWELHKDLTAYIEIERSSILQTTSPSRRPSELFISARGRALSAGHIQSIFRAVSNHSAVKVTPHMLRHTYATYEYLQTGDLPRLKKLLGHSMLETTQVYCEFAILAAHSVEYQKILANWENRDVRGC